MVKRLEKLAGREVSGGSGVKLTKKISQYLTSTIGGDEVETKFLGNKDPRQPSLHSGRCSPRIASLGAQREAVKAAIRSSPSQSTSGREGRVELRKMEVKKRGFGPSAKWLKAEKSGDEGFRKVEEDKGMEEVRRCPDQRVKSIKEKFERAGEAKASQMERSSPEKQDPDLGLDPGGRA